MVERFSEMVDSNKFTFECKLCNYTCLLNQHLKQHITTRKHKYQISRETNKQNNIQESNQNAFICICGNTYKHRSSLCKHKKTCAFPEKTATNEIIINDLSNELTNEFIEVTQKNAPINLLQITPEMIYEIIKQNQEFKSILLEDRNEMKTFFAEHNDKMMELARVPTIGNQINNQNTNNNFNLNVFLNEKCKDAINIKQFVEQLVIDADSVQYSGTHGFVAGVTHVITEGLNKLDLFTRPFHCVDLKREIMYVKIDDTWLKDVNNTAMMNIITHVIQRNMGQIPAWAEANPESNVIGSDLFDAQFSMLREVTGGSGDRYRINTEKVFRVLAKETLIDKSK